MCVFDFERVIRKKVHTKTHNNVETSNAMRTVIQVHASTKHAHTGVHQILLKFNLLLRIVPTIWSDLCKKNFVPFVQKFGLICAKKICSVCAKIRSDLCKKNFVPFVQKFGLVYAK